MEKRFSGFPKKEKEPNRCKKIEDNVQNDKKRELIVLEYAQKNLNRSLFPRRAVYLDAIAENPELRLGILILALCQ